MKISYDFAGRVWLVLFVFPIAVASLQAQSATNPAEFQTPVNLSAASSVQKDATTAPGEIINIRPKFDSRRIFASPNEKNETRRPAFEPAIRRFAPQTSFFPKRVELKPEPLSEVDSSSAILPRRPNVTFPANPSSALPKQTSAAYVRPNAKERFKDYVSAVVGPYALLGTAAFAGIFHYRDLPNEWENDSKGYARRFGSALGILAINETTVYALDEAFKLDSNYYKSTKKTIRGRLQDAIVNSFVARKPDGKRVFGFPRVAGNYGSAIIAEKTWYPKRFGYKDALVDGTYSVGVDVLFNIAREFFWH